MRKQTVRGVGLIAMGILCGFSWSSAKISEIKMCKDVDPKEKTPIEVTDTFAADTPVVYCTAKLSRAPEGTEVKAEFYYLEGGEQKIAEVGMPGVSGTRYVSFKLTPPPAGWPVGKYKTAILLDGKPKGEALFSVAAGAAAEKPAPKAEAPAPAPADYRTFSSPDHGFTMKYPSDWVEGERTSPAIAFLYLANKNNDPIGNINVQVIPVTLKNPSQTKDAVNLIAQQLIDQITKTPGAAIKNDDWVNLGKNTGRELVFEYPANNKAIKQRQFITFHNNNVYAVIYTAENSSYDSFLGSYEKAVESLSFL